ncbi:MAG: hypothetical protein Alpg2KO_20420 [Alphaproteobacteria bacterium]
MIRVGLGRVLLALALFFCTISPAFAQERITRYHTVLEVQPSGRLLVQEQIDVIAEGSRIRRGIFRDLPTLYQVPEGLAKGLHFITRIDVLEVKRNDHPEPYQIQDMPNGDMRLRIGQRDVRLDRGLHRYLITYSVDRALIFDEGTDRLFWNVIGPEWDFPIEQASVTLVTPGTVNLQYLTGYVGRAGENTPDIQRATAPGLTIETTRPLIPQEGFTIDLVWDAGVIPRPSLPQRLVWMAYDNQSVLIISITLLVTFFYYLIWWLRVGKDPAEGTVIPRYKPPVGLSPASVRYLLDHHFDDRAMTATIVSLAVKGHLRIVENDDDTMTLIKEQQSRENKLHASERSILKALFSNGDELHLDGEGHSEINRARGMLTNGLAAEHKRHYRANTGVVAGGTILSFLGGFLMFVTFPGAFNWWMGAPFLLLIGCNLLFWPIMDARTREGQRLKDQIEGLRLYLSVAEQDRIESMRKIPPMTGRLYQRLLPYAIALGVEAEWTRKLQDAAAALSQNPDALRKRELDWVFDSHVDGLRWLHRHNRGVMSMTWALGDTLTDSVSASAVRVAPSQSVSGSSSSSSGGSFGGFGGGSVGGGFGGGGGGGW